MDKVTVRESAHALQEYVFTFNCWLEPASEEGELSSVTVTPPGKTSTPFIFPMSVVKISDERFSTMLLIFPTDKAMIDCHCFDKILEKIIDMY